MRTCVRLAASVVVTLTLGLVLASCERPTDQRIPAPANNDPVVFDDALSSGGRFEAFLGSKLDALSVDTVERFEGTSSLKVAVPLAADGWSGGAFPTSIGRDLSEYDALTFWAKASVSTTVNEIGIGNDNTGTSLYSASWANIPVTTSWQRYVLPIPVPSRLTRERGLFYFAEGAGNSPAYDLWFDEIKFERTGVISNARPGIRSAVVNAYVGNTVEVAGTLVTFDVDGTDEVISASQYYFDFSSSDENVVSTANNRLTVVGPGEATITAQLDGVDALGSVRVMAEAPPSSAAPTPTYAAGDVISLFSNPYDDVPVTTFSPDWDRANVSDTQLDGNDTKLYTDLSWAAIEFAEPVIDASAMTHFSVDIWISRGNIFKMKLVDFGSDGIFGEQADSESQLTFNATSDPALAVGQWVTFDIPLASFTGLASTSHLAQLILEGDMETLYMDNLLFHR